MDRFEELQAKVREHKYLSLTMAEREEYQALKHVAEDIVAAPVSSPEVVPVAPTTTVETILPQASAVPAPVMPESTVTGEKLTLSEICDKLFFEIKDGNARATLNAYKNLTSDQTLLNNLKQLMGDLKTGEDKGKVYRYIRELGVTLA